MFVVVIPIKQSRLTKAHMSTSGTKSITTNDINNVTYRIIYDNKVVGGVILKIDNLTHLNELEILFILPNEHNKGLGYATWKEIENLYKETEVWSTCTPYFEKRNIHFYVNKCGFKIDEFWCEYFHNENNIPKEDHLDDEGPDEMFHLIKVMK